MKLVSFPVIIIVLLLSVCSAYSQDSASNSVRKKLESIKLLEIETAENLYDISKSEETRQKLWNAYDSFARSFCGTYIVARTQSRSPNERCDTILSKLNTLDPKNVIGVCGTKGFLSKECRIIFNSIESRSAADSALVPPSVDKGKLSVQSEKLNRAKSSFEEKATPVSQKAFITALEEMLPLECSSPLLKKEGDKYVVVQSPSCHEHATTLLGFNSHSVSGNCYKFGPFSPQCVGARLKDEQEKEKSTRGPKKDQQGFVSF